MSAFEVLNPEKGVWVIRDESINLYLAAGEERAALIDTGFGFFENLRETCEQLCHLPVVLYHTHAHGDHTGGDAQWEEAWLHPSEWEFYRSDRGDGTRLHALEEGMQIDLGGRVLEVLHVPGHTAGSCAFLDREARILFSGDTVMAQPVFLFTPGASAKDFLSSLQRLRKMDSFDVIYPCHSRLPLKPAEAIDALLDCAERAVRSDAERRTEFEIHLLPGVTEHYEGYLKDGFGVATRQLGIA